MRFRAFLSFFVTTFICLPYFPAEGCNDQPVSHSADSDSVENAFTIGTDSSADAATLGYTMNHFALLVNDIDASMHFYGKVLGMRHIFTYQATSSYTIAYMGYSHDGKNGTGYQTGEELYAEKGDSEGLLELLHLKGSEELLSTTKRVSTFSHVGLVVPNVEAAQTRMEQYSIKILKSIGEDVEPGNDLARAYGFGSSLREARAAAKGIEAIGFEYFFLVANPASNAEEIQQQTL